MEIQQLIPLFQSITYSSCLEITKEPRREKVQINTNLKVKEEVSAPNYLISCL